MFPDIRDSDAPLSNCTETVTLSMSTTTLQAVVFPTVVMFNNWHLPVVFLLHTANHYFCRVSLKMAHFQHLLHTVSLYLQDGDNVLICHNNNKSLGFNTYEL